MQLLEQRKVPAAWQQQLRQRRADLARAQCLGRRPAGDLRHCLGLRRFGPYPWGLHAVVMISQIMGVSHMAWWAQ